MIIYKCNYPTCRVKLDQKGWCPAHFKARNKKRHAIYDKAQRDPEMVKFYNSARWKKARALQLSREPFCNCGKPAVIVHHKTPAKGMDYADRLDPEHLESKCWRCHSRVEARKRIEEESGKTFVQDFTQIDWQALRPGGTAGTGGAGEVGGTEPAL